MAQSDQASGNKLLKTLLITVVVMFGFSFALVPFYNVFCKVTGLNGKTSNQAHLASELSGQVDESRWITVEFVATNNQQLPWEFHPDVSRIRVHPGEIANTAFFAGNETDHAMTVQAIPSVSPGLAAKHLKKIECFCFTQQTLDGHVSRHMPLRFVVDKDLPKDIDTLTLSYTLFDLGKVKEHV